MKDLKYIHFFEQLLESANNELVQKAKADGKVAVGYSCYYIPEALFNCSNAFSIRLSAPNTGSLDISQYYMTSFICGYVRALFERAFEGGYNFLDFYASSDTCQQMVRVVENIHELELVSNKKFAYGVVDSPLKISPHGLKLYEEQLKLRFMKPLEEKFGVDFSDKAIREAVKLHNEMCEVFEEMCELRKAANPVITPREFHIISIASYTCPTYLILPYLKETLKELKKRKPDPVNKWRARVVVIGSELDDYAFSEILENNRCYVVADRYCFGTFPGRQKIILNDEESALTQVCRNYLETNQCPRFMSQEKIQQRRDYAKKLVEEYGADGIIYEQAKFCDFWGYERMLNTQILREEYGVPTLGVDREYVVRGSGQLATRVQAFVESLEIKKIQEGGEK